MGLAFHPDSDKNFEKLKNIAEFKDLMRLFEQNRKPLNRSAIAFKLPEKDFVIEGIAYDAKSRRFFVSTIYKRKIAVIEPDGNIKDFSTFGDGLWGVFGMKVDDKRRFL